MIRQEKAKYIAASWHGGQWSAFYQFASSGIYLLENHLSYLQEIEYCLHPEHNPHPGELTKGEETELNQLKNYIIKQGEKNGVKTVWMKHHDYGYDIPCVSDDTPPEMYTKVKKIYYPV